MYKCEPNIQTKNILCLLGYTNFSSVSYWEHLKRNYSGLQHLNYQEEQLLPKKFYNTVVKRHKYFTVSLLSVCYIAEWTMFQNVINSSEFQYRLLLPKFLFLRHGPWTVAGWLQILAKLQSTRLPQLQSPAVNTCAEIAVQQFSSFTLQQCSSAAHVWGSCAAPLPKDRRTGERRRQYSYCSTAVRHQIF